MKFIKSLFAFLCALFVACIFLGIYSLLNYAYEYHKVIAKGFPEITRAADLHEHVGEIVKINAEIVLTDTLGTHRSRRIGFAPNRTRSTNYRYTLHLEDGSVSFRSIRQPEGIFDGYAEVTGYESLVFYNKNAVDNELRLGIISTSIGIPGLLIFLLLHSTIEKREKKQYAAKQAKLAALHAEKLRAAKMNQPQVNRPQRPRPK